MKKYLLFILVLSFVCLPAAAQTYNQKYPIGSMVDYSDPLADGLVGWWRFAERMGNKTWDSSGNDIVGEITNFSQTAWGIWKRGRALFFDGLNDHVALGDGRSWEDDSVGTVTAWVTLNGAVGNNLTREFFTSVDSGDFNSGCRFLVWNPPAGDAESYLSVFCYEASAKKIQVRITAPMILDQWYFVAVVQDGIAIKIYMDAIQQTVTHSGTTDHGAWFDTVLDQDFNTIGGLPLARFWDGYIDDLRVYNRPLTDAEITELFLDHNRPLFPPGMGLSMSGAVRQGVAQVIMIE